MGAFRDFMDAFKGATPGGETAAGQWRYMERFGRFSGMGAAEARIELPEGKAVISNEEIREIDAFEIKVTGPDGAALPMKRLEINDDHSEQGMHNLFPMAEVEVTVPGIHRIRVKAPDPGAELVILVGRDLTTKEAMLGTFGGAGDPFKRR